MAGVALAALPAMFVAGRLADRFGGRLVPTALAIFAVATAFPGLADSVPELFVALAFVGIGTGALDVAINAQASNIEARHDVRVMDGLHAMFSAGVLCGGVGTGLLRAAGAEPSWILGGIALTVAVTAVANRKTSAPPERVGRRARPGRRLIVAGAILGLAFLVEAGVEGWSALFLERVFDSGPAVSGLGPGVFAASMVVGRLVAHRIERPPVTARMLFAGVAAAGGIALAVSAQHAAVALVGFAAAGAGLALSAPTLFGHAGRLGGEGRRGSAVATVALLGYPGFVIGPPLIGAVSGATSLRGGFAFLCAVAVLLAACSPLLRESRA